MKCLSLVKFQSSIPAPSPSSPSGKGSNALKAEARDVGPTVLPVFKREAGRPFSSQPGSMERPVYRGFPQKGKVKQRAQRVAKFGTTWRFVSSRDRGSVGDQPVLPRGPRLP